MIFVPMTQLEHQSEVQLSKESILHVERLPRTYQYLRTLVYGALVNRFGTEE